MTRTLRVRFWIEAVLGTISALLCVVTLLSREWIEATTGIDADNHDGSLEWALVASLAIATCVLVASARIEWRRYAVQRTRVTST